jgi:hypothetical protein
MQENTVFVSAFLIERKQFNISCTYNIQTLICCITYDKPAQSSFVISLATYDSYCFGVNVVFMFWVQIERR